MITYEDREHFIVEKWPGFSTSRSKGAEASHYQLVLS